MPGLCDRDNDLALTGILTDPGGLYVWLGRLDEARVVLKEAEALHARHNATPRPGMRSDPLLGFSLIAFYY
jgi:hypothetical protein